MREVAVAVELRSLGALRSAISHGADRFGPLDVSVAKYTYAGTIALRRWLIPALSGLNNAN